MTEARQAVSDPVPALAAQVRDWFERARAAGWLSERELARLAAIEQRAPGDLFPDGSVRPLVVAFFGGTGVGKSSLLNRLAGQPIARTGPERPTSREVTIYLHESVELAELPPELPVEHVRVERHRVADRRGVLWLDAPDIDSTHEDNRRLALAWLPHTDLLVYVVSPERYRDDAGWRVLLARRQRHGWMFVLNRWDEGDLGQKEDFARLLREAGFNDPLLLCTCCRQPPPPLPGPDEFAQIESTIQALLAAHGVAELERLGQRARLLEMRDAVVAAREPLGQQAHWRQLTSRWGHHWHATRATLLEGAEWPLRAAASRLAIRERALLERVLRQAVGAARVGLKPEPGPQRSKRSDADAPPTDEASNGALPVESLWDDWSQDRLQEALDALEVEARRLGIAAAPIRRRLDAVAGRAAQVVVDQVRQRVRLALARPGTRLQRAARRVTGFLTLLLPFLALLWVTVNVVEGYRAASRGAASYLGPDFAIHSALLILTAWAVPFVCDRLLRPSLERTALRAMRLGLAAGLDELGAQLHAALSDAAREAEQHREEAGRLLGEVSRLALRPVEVTRGPLARLLAAAGRTRAAPGDGAEDRQPASAGG